MLTQRWRGAAWCGLVMAVGATPDALAQRASPPLASAAIDPSIYREGEVKRFRAQHGRWSIVCDEVTRLKQRFCSLRTEIAGAAGATAAALTISTGQDGRPAALLQLAATLVEGGAVEVTPAGPQGTEAATKGGAKTKAPAAPAGVTRVLPVSCAAGVCTVIWTLRSEQIDALNLGRGLTLVVAAVPDLEAMASLRKIPPLTTTLAVSGDGFKDAVTVSVKGFE